MSLYAQVIVDVPTMQTNKPYTYLVPSELEEQIQAGMRCVVPFGKGSRKIQGFVLDVSNQKPDEDFEIKKIISLMDFAPVLNEEALQLADWMANYTFSFKISCLQTMLPNVMRAGYEKSVRLLDENVEPEIKKLFDQNNLLAFDDKMDAKIRRKIYGLRKEDKVEIVYHVNDRARVKETEFIKSKITAENISAFLNAQKKTATKKKRMLEKLLDLGNDPVERIKFQKQNSFTSNDVKQAENSGWLSLASKETYRNPSENATTESSSPRKLTDEQNVCVTRINQAIEQEESDVFLLQGVTGSGKTEVYLQTIAHALKLSKKALMLVPEISLTPQMVRRVKGRFGPKVAMLHSALSDGERFDEWRRIERGEAQVVVGARSAVFAPLDRIGIIIMDEEHETSYKQDEMPRYNAREVAIWRGKHHHCPVVLGSATPSLESRARGQKSVYQRLLLTKRINGRPMPHVELVDMREALKSAPSPDFSAELLAKIKEHLKRDEQVVLMLNRRGYSSFVMCRECGFVLKCPNCDISLTLHMDTHSMKCHYCGHEEAIPRICPSCRSNKIRYYGTGTQKVEEQLHELIPDAGVLRMDVDTTRRKGAHERLLERFSRHEADILLGTQMIAKGLDFPDVTLVGVLNADTALGLPDFRSSEKTFQLLTQVSGRAGRADKNGEVVIQTFNKEHYAIQLACTQEYERFYAYEMQLRHRLGYPPYYFTIKITASYDNEADACRKMYEIRRELSQVLSKSAKILGPTPKAIMRVNNRYYYQIVIEYKKEPRLEEYLQDLLVRSQTDEPKGLKLIIDRDPISFM